MREPVYLDDLLADGNENVRAALREAYACKLVDLWRGQFGCAFERKLERNSRQSLGRHPIY